MESAANNKLREFYGRLITEFVAPALDEKYAGPFLISCPESYLQTKCKWMIVGQETNDWARLGDEGCGVRELMHWHQSFDLAQAECSKSERHRPFWRFAHKLDELLNQTGKKGAFIWANLARIGFKNRKGRVPDEQLDFWILKRMLAFEISLLEPELVLFTTGPNYDPLLKDELHQIDLPRLSVNSPVSILSHKQLPRSSFRSYHPGFLRQKKLEDQVIDYIVDTYHENRRAKAQTTCPPSSPPLA